MKIIFDSADEYDALNNSLNSAFYYWKKRLQECQGKLVMSLDDKGNPTTTHYTEEECRHEMKCISLMIEVVMNQTHYEIEWNEVMDDWVDVAEEGVTATYVEPEEVEDVVEEVVEVVEDVVEGKLLLNPRPILTTDMIEWMNRPAYAKGRWNLGYKDNGLTKESD